MIHSSAYSAMRRLLVCACSAVLSLSAAASGVLPDGTIVLLSAGEGQVQMGVRNTESEPLLMNVIVHDLPGSEELSVIPLPQVSRLEPNARQMVRLVLSKPATDITRQYLKRVSFEGIPPKNTDPTKSVLKFNVRQTIPLVISPKGLEQDPEPWKKLKIVRTGPNKLELRNDSPFVVRLNADAVLLPMKAATALLKNSYVLPGEKLAVELPSDVHSDAVMAVRIQPASPWGFAVDPYEIPISPASVS